MPTKREPLSFWPLLLLASFVPSLIPQPVNIIGHIWKPELLTAIFLLASLTAVLLSRHFYKPRLTATSVELPLFLFVMWSAASMAWATSVNGALHHTLLWGAYLVFFLLVRRSLSLKQPRLDLQLLGAVAFIIVVSGVAEYIGSVKPITEAFTFRFSKYAEMLMMLAPLFLALALQSKGKGWRAFAVLFALCWGLAFLTTSRSALLGGLVASFAFFVLMSIYRGRRQFYVRLANVVLILATVYAFTLAPVWAPEQASDVLMSDHKQSTLQSRYLFWGIAWEAVKSDPIKGIGGDNYITFYREGRTAYSALDPMNPLLEMNEENLPERAHNEFLQIFAELGIVGVLLIAWMLGLVAYKFFTRRRQRVSLLTIAALCGIAAFLVSSGASAYSFRVVPNGLCFFFLLALALRGLETPEVSEKPQSNGKGIAVVAFAMAICLGLAVTSGMRALSLMYTAQAGTASDPAHAREKYESAIAIDSEDPLIRYYYGQWLMGQQQHKEAAVEMRYAIDRGIAGSPSFFMLSTIYRLDGDQESARSALEDGVKMYPRSVFLRTAYAASLRERGMVRESLVELMHASFYDPKQVASWYVAHTEGLERLALRVNNGEEFLHVYQLKPQSATMALAHAEGLLSRKPDGD